MTRIHLTHLWLTPLSIAKPAGQVIQHIDQADDRLTWPNHLANIGYPQSGAQAPRSVDTHSAQPGPTIMKPWRTPMSAVPVSELKSYIGKDLGHSEWITIDQQRVNQFAECTGDHQFIHIDEEKAKQTPFGGTIAHGFLSLSLIPALSAGLLIKPEGLKMAVNYGLDSLRFIQPVRVGSRVRLNVTVLDVTEKNPGQWLIKARNTLEIEGVDKPAFIAEGLSLYFV